MKIIVKKDDTLLNYLYNNLDMPKKRIKQYLTHGSIYINNNKITKYDYKVVTGMTINIDTTNKKELPFDILFEDENIIVVNKPSGLLTIATSKEKEKTLYHMVRQYLVSKNKFSKVFIVHRLDKDTSGVVILAKNKKIKDKLQENWNEFVKLREYTAVVSGHPKKDEDTIIQNLSETKTNLVYVSKNGKEAITNYKVIKKNNNYSMLSIKISTGRKNQIRVALASINNPILGDKKYGDKKSKYSRLYLHANRLKIYYPIIKKDILFETQVPVEFKKIMNNKK
ncbi:MAG: RluA family pseudouridine synthase [Bacilli bacterium]|nr:RluA family pseudouridine synthase [Bacilli bacterium]MBR3049403.1 RluA family pseudouridine synthase [Bacilli bacterium]